MYYVLVVYAAEVVVCVTPSGRGFCSVDGSTSQGWWADMMLCERIHTYLLRVYSWLCVRTCVVFEKPINSSLHWSLFGDIRMCIELSTLFISVEFQSRVEGQLL